MPVERLPEFVRLGRSRYEVIVISHVQWLGFSADCVVRHKTKQIFIARAVPARERPAVLRQACEEAALILSGPTAQVA